MKSAVTWKFTFGSLLPALPLPGTPAFGQLCKRLKRYGLTAEKFNFETPTTRLSDVRAIVSLLEDTVSLRIQFEWFELFVPALIKGQENPVIEIANEVISALTLMDPDVGKGDLIVQSLSHLRLESGDLD